MTSFRIFIIFFFYALCVLPMRANDSTAVNHKVEKMKKRDYIPKVHGTVRAKYEYSPQINASRFQVRNARVSLNGLVHRMVGYKAEIDLSDKGRIKMLDAYVRVKPVSGLSLTLGQMKLPFSTDNLRSPHNQYFANRSFIAKNFAGLRDVGFTVGYNAKDYFPVEVLLGVYNGEGLLNQSEWKKHFYYSARLVFNTCRFFAFDINWKSIQPDDMRMNVFDFGMRADFYGVHLETEGVYKIYPNKSYGDSYGFTGTAMYDIMLPKVFEKVRILARYDMMSDDNTGIRKVVDDKKIDDFIMINGRQRVTAGVSLVLNKPFLAELRINYEKYFYKDWSVANISDQDKLVIEIMARF